MYENYYFKNGKKCISLTTRIFQDIIGLYDTSLEVKSGLLEVDNHLSKMNFFWNYDLEAMDENNDINPLLSVFISDTDFLVD